MKNSKIYSKLGELSIKYANIGLTIDFEFNRFEMILRGFLDLSLNTYEVYKFNRAYSYELIESLSDEIDIETLVDRFKEEVFEQYKLSKKDNSDVGRYCTECPYFKDIVYKGLQWYGARCDKDGHTSSPSMYAIQSLHDDCPYKTEREDEK